MAADLTQREAGGDSGSGQAPYTDPTHDARLASNDSDVDADGEEGTDAEEEDESEPTLKYSRLTPNIPWVYRNGDSTSSFMVSADKMNSSSKVNAKLLFKVIGTHGGNLHVLSLPSLESVRSYKAHSSSITSISVSPYLPIFPNSVFDASSLASGTPQGKTNKQAPATSSPQPKNSPNRQPVPATPSNAIYIATSSIDGHVCVSSLVDTKDVTLRNYARPVHAVALSPSFKSDRTYLSGGTAGELILTVGGKSGVSADANTNSAASAASGWLGTIGLGSNTGKDTVLHSNEGTITSIKWSLSGKYVVWNNEYGTRIMRSHLHLGMSESDLAWKRVGHVARPNKRVWQDMAGVWKARAQWIDENSFESHDAPSGTMETTREGASPIKSPVESARAALSRTSTSRTLTAKNHSQERLMIGWGDTVWVIHVRSKTPDLGQNAAPAKAEIIHQFTFSDCIVSGLTLYTPSLLAALVYSSKDDQTNANSTPANGTPRRGKGRQNGLPPELRLIDLDSPDKEEIEAESLVVRSFESLSAVDYSLSSLFIPPVRTSPSQQRGASEGRTGGLRDVTYSATRLFSSSASVLSGSSSEGKPPSSADRVNAPTLNRAPPKDVPPVLANPGLKIFIHSQYDCIVAVKRDLTDQLSWFLDHEEYENAWLLLNKHPNIFSASSQADSRPETPSKPGHSLADFFDDGTSSVGGSGEASSSKAVEREKQRIGSLWIQQLVTAGEWSRAGEIAGKVLGDSQRWSDWIFTFANAQKFDEIVPYIPRTSLHPPLPPEVYEVVLGHYIKHDKERLHSLLEQWSPTLFDIRSVISAIKDNLELEITVEDSLVDEVQGKDQRILLDALAKLYLATNDPGAAIRCYVRIRNADRVLSLIREYRMIDAISDDVFVFILIRISPTQRAKAPLQELDNLSSEPIGLLASAAIQGIISPSVVVSQLEPKAPSSRPYLFFYFRALWKGDVIEGLSPSGETSAQSAPPRTSRFRTAEIKTRTAITPHADLAVTLFAEYSQPLLNEFLKQTRDYDLAHAAEECRRQHLIPELVYLLHQTGQTTEALHLIIDELDDVSEAVSFAKKVDDPGLWADLVEYSMDKPKFICGVLEEVGTSIDPVTVVRRIPQGIEVPGLKDSLTRLVKDIETSWSITEGASKILSSEVAIVLKALRRRRERGLVFDANGASVQSTKSNTDSEKQAPEPSTSSCSGCVSCQIPFGGSLSVSDLNEGHENLIGFACGHLFHLSCLLDSLANDVNKRDINQLHKELSADNAAFEDSMGTRGSVGTKIRHAQMIQKALGDFGCYVCKPPSSAQETAGEG